MGEHKSNPNALAAAMRRAASGSETGEQTITHNLETREPPGSVVALRNELPLHKEIYDKAIQGRNFEECLAIIGAELGIILDGIYNAPDLCAMLVRELQRKRAILADGTSIPRDPALVSAAITVTKDSITIDEVTEGGVIIPEGARTHEEVQTKEGLYYKQGEFQGTREESKAEEEDDFSGFLPGEKPNGEPPRTLDS